MMSCPLCHMADCRHYYSDDHRDYFQCNECCLVFVPSEQRLSSAAEKARYDQHENHIHDLGYRGFLSRLYLPLSERVLPPAEGLDFGCGPGPALATMFEEAGYQMSVYDPFYDPHTAVLEHKYDFISCSEVVEHLFEPGKEIAGLLGMLRPGGWLGIMTSLLPDLQGFKHWYYKNDPTHVCFYSQETFRWLSSQYHCSLEMPGKDVMLMKNTAVSG